MGTAGREASAVVPRDTRAEGLLEDRLVVQRLNQRECCHAWEVRFNRQTFIQSARLPMNAKLPPALSNRQLLTALSHPTRTHLLMTLSERIETPKNLAGELGCPIRHVEYHLGVLEDLSCVELVKTEESPGGKVLAHYYRATDDQDPFGSVHFTRPEVATDERPLAAARHPQDDCRPLWPRSRGPPPPSAPCTAT